MKRILPFIFIATLLIFQGCAQPQRQEVETGLQDNAFAVVNGEPISQSEYLSFYNGNLAEMDATQQELIDRFGDDEVANYENDVLDDLITQQVLLQYAEDKGIDEIPEDIKTELWDSAGQYLDNIKSELSDQISVEGASGILINASAELEKRYEGYLKEYGLNQEVVAQQLERQYIIERVHEDIMTDFEMSDADVQQYYDDALKQQQDYAEAFPEEAAQIYLQGSNDIQLYVPESVVDKARYVKHILIMPPEEYNEAIQAATSEGDDETVTQLSEEAMDEAKQLAEEVIKELDSGADFDELVEIYNEDPGMAMNPEGYLIYEGAPYVENFLNQGLALENIGDYTEEPVETEYGYHIIMYASDPVPGAIPFSEVEEQIRPVAESEARSEFWTESVDTLVENAQIDKIVMTVNDIY